MLNGPKTLSMSSLEERVALVVGAGYGPGRELARQLAEAGALVALNDLVPNAIEDLTADLGASSKPFPADVSKKLSLQGLVQDVLDAYARIDILVFASAVQPHHALLEMDEWDWRHALDLNLNAAFLALQSIGRVMRAQGGGQVLILVDHPGEGDAPPSAAYRTASAALAALAASAAEQLAEHGIRVQAIPANDAGRILDYLDSTD